MIEQTLFQLTSAVASIGRVKTSSYVVSRRFNAIALGAVVADFAAKYAHTGRADFLVGLFVFVVLTVRTLLILGFSKIEEHVPAARHLHGRVPGLRRGLHSGEVLSGRPHQAANSTAAGRRRPWLPGRVVKQHDCAPAVRPVPARL